MLDQLKVNHNSICNHKANKYHFRQIRMPVFGLKYIIMKLNHGQLDENQKNSSKPLSIDQKPNLQVASKKEQLR